VRISGLDRSPEGRLALGDASEGNVKLYSPSGALLGRIGRKGDGPGEFHEPRFPRFATDGRLHIADGANGRVSVFGGDGALVRTLQLGKFTYLTGFEVLPGGRGYVFESEDSDGYVLFQSDSTGAIVHRYLRIRDTKPRGQVDGPFWKNVRGFGLAVRNDSAFVVCTISDTLWMVDLESGNATGLKVTPPGYEIPRQPEGNMKSIADLMKWSRSLQLAVSVVASGEDIVVNFVTGVLNAGDPNTAVVRRSDGRWVAVGNAPAFVRGDSYGLVTLASAGDSTTANVVLNFLTSRQRSTARAAR